MLNLYMTGNDWSTDRYMYICQVPAVLISSIEETISGQQMGIVIKVGIPTCSILQLIQDKEDSSVLKNNLVSEIYVNEVILNEYLSF